MTGPQDGADAVVIGGGIAGISAAFELAGTGHAVVLVEREPTLTAHSTGRSAAQFLASYGEATNRRLSAASRLTSSGARFLLATWGCSSRNSVQSALLPSRCLSDVKPRLGHA